MLLSNRTGIFSLVLAHISGNGLTEAYVSLPDGEYIYSNDYAYLNTGKETRPQFSLYSAESVELRYGYSIRASKKFSFKNHADNSF